MRPTAASHGSALSRKFHPILTCQARALHAELLAGHKQPKNVPQWALDKVDIADSGCGTSFGNRRELFRDMYVSPSRVNGAAGAFMTKEKGPCTTR
mgnify:CR=1 FL=1